MNGADHNERTFHPKPTNMNYYLKEPHSPVFTGPFPADVICRRLAAGTVSAKALVAQAELPSTGNSALAWVSVSSIAGPSNPAPASMPESRIAEAAHYCAFCRRQASGPVVLGKSRCEHCGKLLYPAAEAVERISPQPSRQVSTVTFIVGLIGGLIAQFGSFMVAGGFAAVLFGLRKSGNQAAIVVAMVLCLVWVVAAISMTRSPANRGFAFGVLLGVGVTALLTANCAVNSLK